TIVDVSLLGTGIWSMGAGLALSLQFGVPWAAPARGAPTGNPLVGNYETKDGRHVALCCLQAGKYWAETCEVVGRPELAADARFADAAAIGANAGAAHDLLAEAFEERTAEEWREQLAGFSGQWAMVQDTLEAAADPQTLANGYGGERGDGEGGALALASAPR